MIDTLLMFVTGIAVGYFSMAVIIFALLVWMNYRELRAYRTCFSGLSPEFMAYLAILWGVMFFILLKISVSRDNELL